MPIGIFTFQDGDSTRTGQVLIPPSARPDFPSAYCFAFPKSGSSLVNSLAASLVAECQITPVNFPAYLYNEGIDIAACLGDLAQLFPDRGYFIHGFREKPRWMLGVSSIGSAKKLMIVRDPRDMLVSLYFSVRYSHGFVERGSTQFSNYMKLLISDVQTDIDSYCCYYTWLYNAQLQCMGDVISDKSTLILKYEDFVYDKKALAESICEFLALEIPARRILEIIEPFNYIPSEEQYLQHIRQVHPGDFRRKLKPETIEALNLTLGNFFSQFKYEI